MQLQFQLLALSWLHGLRAIRFLISRTFTRSFVRRPESSTNLGIAASARLLSEWLAAMFNSVSKSNKRALCLWHEYRHITPTECPGNREHANRSGSFPSPFDMQGSAGSSRAAYGQIGHERLISSPQD